MGKEYFSLSLCSYYQQTHLKISMCCVWYEERYHQVVDMCMMIVEVINQVEKLFRLEVISVKTYD